MTAESEAAVLTAIRAAQHIRLPRHHDAYKCLCILTLLSSLGPLRLMLADTSSPRGSITGQIIHRLSLRHFDNQLAAGRMVARGAFQWRNRFAGSRSFRRSQSPIQGLQTTPVSSLLIHSFLPSVLLGARRRCRKLPGIIASRQLAVQTGSSALACTGVVLGLFGMEKSMSTFDETV